MRILACDTAAASRANRVMVVYLQFQLAVAAAPAVFIPAGLNNFRGHQAARSRCRGSGNVGGILVHSDAGYQGSRRRTISRCMPWHLGLSPVCSASCLAALGAFALLCFCTAHRADADFHRYTSRTHNTVLGRIVHSHAGGTGNSACQHWRVGVEQRWDHCAVHKFCMKMQLLSASCCPFP